MAVRGRTFGDHRLWRPVKVDSRTAPARRSLSFVRARGNAGTSVRGANVRSIISAVIGGLLGFGAAALAIGAVVLLAAGVGGGILVRKRPGEARVLNYDPSDVVIKAAATGAAALLVLVVFVAVYFWLRRQENRRKRLTSN